MKVSLAVNGVQQTHDVAPRLLLVNYLRDVLGLTGAHIACDTSQCGACTVVMNGQSVKSCTVLAVQAEGASIMTIEALGRSGDLHPLQEGMWEQHGLQCGYCTPGMIMTAYGLLLRNPHPTEEEIRHGIEGNLCRCTGYQNIVKAIKWASEQMDTVGGPHMFPSPFEYVAASSTDEAIALLGQYGDDAKLLAGGHSLLPMMKLRLAAPGVLIDINRIPGLAGIQVADDTIALGALTTYTTIASSRDLAAVCPLLPDTAAHVGDTQVRNRGTVGGSIAHADPAADMPAAMLALDATFTARGARGERTLAASDFFQGLFTTALEPGEVLTRISFSRFPARTGMAYEKFRNPASGYAIVGVAAVVVLADDGTVSDVRVAITGAGAQPVRATSVEQFLRGKVADLTVVADAAHQAADGLQLMGDLHASEGYRAHLTRVYTRRALQRALQGVLPA